MERCNNKAQISAEPRLVQSHEDGTRARVSGIACYTVSCSGRQKTAAGLYDYHRQRHTKLRPQPGGKRIPAYLCSLLLSSSQAIYS